MREALPGYTYARAARLRGADRRRARLELGERLAVVLDNRVETALLYWAAQWAGVVFVPALLAAVGGRARLLPRGLRRRPRRCATVTRCRTGPSIPAHSTSTSASRA